METKILLQKKKKVIFSLLLIITLFNNLLAQVVYTDFAPDVTPNAGLDLDLNNDSIVDFRLQMGGSDGNFSVNCNPLNNNAYSGNFTGGNYLPWALNDSTNICATFGTWYGASEPGTMAGGTNTGYWVGATDKYLALQLVIGNDTFYGWARLDVTDTSSSFTVKDYAYESTPNACIESRQPNLGIISNNNIKTFSLYPNPFSSITNIKTNTILNNAEIVIYDVFGQKVNSQNNISGNEITINRENLSSGIYFIQILDNDKAFRIHKLVIAD